MTYLFDTQALIWALLSQAKLGLKAATAIGDETNELLVSAASAWEISTKVRLGKLPDAAPLEQNFIRVVTEVAGYRLLPITVETALRAGRLVGDHGDPFDRMIAAQALANDITVISNDKHLDVFGVRRLW